MTIRYEPTIEGLTVKITTREGVETREYVELRAHRPEHGRTTPSVRRDDEGVGMGEIMLAGHLLE